MPQHLPHVVPQIARSKNEEQLLQSLSPERLQSSSRTHSAIRYWTCCPPAKATAWGCVPDEVSRGFEVKGRQVTSITASSLFIHGTDILERPWHRKHKQTHENTRPNFYLDRMGTLIIKAQTGQVHRFHNCNGNVKRSKSLPSSLQCECLSALCHISSCWKCVQGGAHLNASPFKPSEPFCRKNVCGELQVWHAL